jgi:hypothetical protein
MRECIVQNVKYGGVLLKHATLGHYILEQLRPDQKLKYQIIPKTAINLTKPFLLFSSRNQSLYQLLPVT